MITTNLMGGLGNQLFQLFALMSYAETYKQDFFIEDVPSLREDRPFYWDTYLSSLRKYLKPPMLLPVYREPRFSYDAIIPYSYVKQPFKLFGYFQSYKYFKEKETVLMERIQLKNTLDNTRKKYPYEYDSMISMHFRVGDYKYLPDHHTILPPSYYTSALEIMKRTTSSRTVLVFYEEENEIEIKQTIEKLKNRFPDMSFVSIDHSIPDYEQLSIMSCCSHQIIANSTFSWWGAYFNRNPEKVVTYPQTWFGNEYRDKDTSDLFPDTWIKI